MKERPILFSAPMVNAILEGRKTQTRRALSPQPEGGIQVHPFAPHGVLNGEGSRLICRFGQPGDRLWVRETWQHSNFPDGPLEKGCDIFYRADYLDDPLGPDLEKSQDGIRRKWKPSIYMPRAASRITLEITNVRVERLQDISEADAKSEGIYFDPPVPVDEIGLAANYRRSYRDLWESINGAGSCDQNPWVWVLEFKRV